MQAFHLQAWTDKSEPPYPAADRLIIFARPFWLAELQNSTSSSFFLLGVNGAILKHVGSFQPVGVPKKKATSPRWSNGNEWKNLAGSTTYSYTPEKLTKRITKDKLAMSVFFWGGGILNI